MKYATFMFLLLCQTAFAADPIVLTPGEQQSLQVSNAIRSSISNPSIIMAETYSKEEKIVLTGISEGKADLIVWKENGEKAFFPVSVVQKKKNTLAELKSILSEVEGISFQQKEGNLSIHGQIYQSKDLELLQKTLSKYPFVQNYTSINPEALSYFRDHIHKTLHKLGLTQIVASLGNDVIYLQGYVESHVEKKRATQIAQSIYLKIEDHLKVGVSRKNLILVDLKFIEILKTSFKHMGIQWPQEVSIDANSRLRGSSFSTILSVQGTAHLQALIEKGDAHVLSNPKLLCEDGSPASFHAGGEIPIRLISERTASITFKPYGLHLDVTAHSDAGYRTSITIQTRMSNLDLSTAIDGVPGILENKVSTSVNVDFGRTIALAGLIESKSGKHIRKIPMLGHIPILGELFKSRNFRKSKSEFVLFLTPYLANGDNPYHLQQQNLMNLKSKETENTLNYRLLD